MLNYTLIRSLRRTISIQINNQGELFVRAPYTVSEEKINNFLKEKENWIIKNQQKIKQKNICIIQLKENEKITIFGKEFLLKFYSMKKVEVKENELFLPQQNTKVALIKYLTIFCNNIVLKYIDYYSLKIGVKPNGVSITKARTRWGSCSGKNHLNFSFRLILCKPEAVEYVVVHELCHILHHNHSKYFWKEVENQYPNYKEMRKYLKENSQIMNFL